ERVARSLGRSALDTAVQAGERRVVEPDAAALDALQRVAAELDRRRVELRVEDLGERGAAAAGPAGGRRRRAGRRGVERLDVVGAQRVNHWWPPSSLRLTPRS